MNIKFCCHWEAFHIILQNDLVPQTRGQWVLRTATLPFSQTKGGTSLSCYSFHHSICIPVSLQFRPTRGPSNKSRQSIAGEHLRGKLGFCKNQLKKKKSTPCCCFSCVNAKKWSSRSYAVIAVPGSWKLQLQRSLNIYQWLQTSFSKHSVLVLSTNTV